MKSYELLNNVEIQSRVRFAYYDYEKCERISLFKEQAIGKEIRYIYVEDEDIIVEVDMGE